jgi:hypothetical protein
LKILYIEASYLLEVYNVVNTHNGIVI